MNLVLLGAPGAGKGTQASVLTKKFRIPHISTGDIFRAHMEAKTELGILAQSYISKGMLVPDEVTVSLVNRRLQEEDCRQGFLLDGFPRTLPQAEALDRFLLEQGRKLDFVINLMVDDRLVIGRLTKRRTCPVCHVSYHLDYAPPRQKNICDSCGATLIQRADDVEDVIRERLLAYHRQTEPLIQYYTQTGVIRNVEGNGSIEEVLQNTFAVLEVAE